MCSICKKFLISCLRVYFLKLHNSLTLKDYLSEASYVYCWSQFENDKRNLYVLSKLHLYRNNYKSRLLHIKLKLRVLKHHRTCFECFPPKSGSVYKTWLLLTSIIQCTHAAWNIRIYTSTDIGHPVYSAKRTKHSYSSTSVFVLTIFNEWAYWTYVNLP